MLRKLKHRTAWSVSTVFFLLIAWATSIETPMEIMTIPISAHATDQHIWIKSEAQDSLPELTLVLNSIFTKEGVSLAPQEELQIDFSEFEDRNQTPYPSTEIPYSLEIFKNGEGEFAQGGYTIIHFE